MRLTYNELKLVTRACRLLLNGTASIPETLLRLSNDHLKLTPLDKIDFDDRLAAARLLVEKRVSMQQLETLRDICISILREGLASFSMPSSIDYSLGVVYGLSGYIFDVDKGVIAVRYRDVSRASLLILVTRWLPPEMLISPMLQRIRAGRATHNRRTWYVRLKRLRDAHIHFTALTPSALLQSYTANPVILREVCRQKERVGRFVHLRDFIAASVIRQLSRLKLAAIAAREGCASFARFERIDPGSIDSVMSHVKSVLEDVVKGDYTKVCRLRTVLTQVYKRLGLTPSLTIDPLVELLDASHIEVETLLHECVARHANSESVAREYQRYVRASSILHELLTFEDIYAGLELFSRLYERGAIRVDPRSMRTTLRALKLASWHYAHAVLEAKISASRMWSIRFVAHSPVRVGVVFASFVKKGCGFTRNMVCYNEVSLAHRVYDNILRLWKDRRLYNLVRGVDVAGREKLTPNWVYAWFIKALVRRRNDVIISFHAGEDYYSVLNGLRKMYEAIVYIGLRSDDRIGHAIALYDRTFLREPREMILELLEDILFVLAEVENLDMPSHVVDRAEILARKICRSRTRLTECDPWVLAEAYSLLYKPEELLATLLAFEPDSFLADLLLDIGYAPRSPYDRRVGFTLLELLREERLLEFTPMSPAVSELGELVTPVLREAIKEEIKRRGIIIESCPTSNILITAVERLERHPLPRMIKDGLEVRIGSDDPAVLATDIYLEYVLVETLLSKYKGLGWAKRWLRRIFTY